MMIRKIFAGFFAFLFVLLFLPFSLIFGVYSTFSDEDFYKGELIDLVYDFVIEEMPRTADLEAFPTLDEENLREIIEVVFTKEDLELVVGSIVEQFKTATVSDDLTMRFVIPLGWLLSKSDLIAEEVAGYMYDNLEPCADVESFSMDDVQCIPAGTARVDFESMVKTVFDREFLVDVPNEVGFDLNVPGKFDGGIADFVSTTVNIGFLIGLGVLLVLLFLVALIIFRPGWRVLKWVSRTIFTASSLVFVAILGLRFLPGMIVTVEEWELYVGIYSFVMGEVMKDLLVFIVPILVVSFVLWIIGMFFDKSKELKK